jgi:hypothetical protein
MERRTNVPAPIPAAVAASTTEQSGRRRRVVNALACAMVTCGLAGTALAQSAAQPMKGDAAERPQARAAASAPKATNAAPKGDWTRHFTPEEREAWQQKLAAAPDEAERRKLRGQRLAEIQRRTRAQQAEANAQASARPARQAAPETSTPGQRPR